MRQVVVQLQERCVLPQGDASCVDSCAPLAPRTPTSNVQTRDDGRLMGDEGLTCRTSGHCIALRKPNDGYVSLARVLTLKLDIEPQQRNWFQFAKVFGRIFRTCKMYLPLDMLRRALQSSNPKPTQRFLQEGVLRFFYHAAAFFRCCDFVVQTNGTGIFFSKKFYFSLYKDSNLALVSITNHAPGILNYCKFNEWPRVMMTPVAFQEWLKGCKAICGVDHLHLIKFGLFPDEVATSLDVLANLFAIFGDPNTGLWCCQIRF